MSNYIINTISSSVEQYGATSQAPFRLGPMGSISVRLACRPYFASENENLYTPGGEFLEEIKTPGYPTVQRDYVGFYHIHPDKGPMVGSQHIDGPHNYLIPYPVKDEIKKEQKREQMIRDASRSIQPPAPQPPSSTPSTGYGGY